jgi:hypothetical protein
VLLPARSILLKDNPACAFANRFVIPNGRPCQEKNVAGEGPREINKTIPIGARPFKKHLGIHPVKEEMERCGTGWIRLFAGEIWGRKISGIRHQLEARQGIFEP